MKNLDDTWGISAYFNPVGYPWMKRLFITYAKRIRSQGIPLLVVELSLSCAAQEVPDSAADIVIRLQGKSCLWQKERLLNVAVQHLPETCKYVVWLDGDVIFLDENWVDKTRETLLFYPLMQPFNSSRWLDPVATDRIVGRSSSFGATEGISEQQHCERVDHGFASLYRSGCRGLIQGHTGFAWAARREFLNEFGLYDRFVVGGGDLILALSVDTELSELSLRDLLAKHCSGAQVQHVVPWMRRLSRELNGNLGAIEGTICHMWHGQLPARRYMDRYQILKEHDFDPVRDIQIEADGHIEWCTKKDVLVCKVEEFFQERCPRAETTLSWMSSLEG